MKHLVFAAAAAAVLLGSVAPGVAKTRHATAVPQRRIEAPGTFDRGAPPAFAEPESGPSPQQLRMDREDT